MKSVIFIEAGVRDSGAPPKHSICLLQSLPNEGFLCKFWKPLLSPFIFLHTADSSSKSPINHLRT